MLKSVGPTVLYGGISDLRRKACTTPERERESGPQLRVSQWSSGCTGGGNSSFSTLKNAIASERAVFNYGYLNGQEVRRR